MEDRKYRERDREKERAREREREREKERDRERQSGWDFVSTSFKAIPSEYMNYLWYEYYLSDELI